MSTSSGDSSLVEPRMNGDSTLASLAYINVTWESARTSYVDNFVPFVLEVMRAARDNELTPTHIRSLVRERFGLDFPTNVVKSLIDRAVRTKKIERVTRSERVRLADGVVGTLPDITGRQADCRRQQARVVSALVTFANKRFELAWNTEQGETALVEYIEQHVLPLLVSAVRGRPYADSEDPLQGSGYVVSAFVAHVFDQEPELFGYLDQMVKGSMLASALYVDATGQVDRKFRKTTLYLDAPICLRALGHEGEDAREAVTAMLSLARSQGADIACFQHSVKEMRGILQGARSALARSAGAESFVRGVARHYRESGAKPADLDLALATLEDDLEKMRIFVTPPPSHTEAYGVDENEFENVLQKVVGYRDVSTLRIDLDSLTAIHRIRRGSSDGHLETCRAVLVTNNYKLVQASRRFFNSQRHEWPLAMMDNAVTTLLWVKAPMAKPDLPRRQIIADCYSTLAPSAVLWNKLIDEVERLNRRGAIDSSGVALLRYSREAQRAVMDLTYGDPRNLGESTIATALGRARAAAAKPAEDARDAAMASAKLAKDSEAAALFEAAQSEGEARELRERVTALEARQARSAEAIRSRILRRVRICARIVRISTALLVGASLLLGAGTFFPLVTDWIPTSAMPMVRAASLVVLLLGTVTLWRGKSISEWIQRGAEVASRRAIAAAGLDDSSIQ